MRSLTQSQIYISMWVEMASQVGIGISALKPEIFAAKDKMSEAWYKTSAVEVGKS